MRSKSVTKTRKNQTPKAKANGLPHHNGPNRPTEDHRSPQPALSEAQQHQLRAYLDRSEKPFLVATVSANGNGGSSKKRKRSGPLAMPDNFSLQDDLWEDRLTVGYEVRPRDKWDSLRRYKKFTVGAESISMGQCILVKHENDDAQEEQRIDVAAQWKAKVLEVRALDPEHVYLRVAWLNRPEDLASGRKPYHGRNELIPTNQLDVIDAMAVNGTLDVAHWADDDDDSPMISDDQYFWRQTLDYAGSKTFSKLRLICIDNAPQNPDEVIVQCSNSVCRKWLHGKCMALEAAKEAYNDSRSKKNISATSRSVDVPSSAQPTARGEKGGFMAELFIQDLSSSEDLKEEDESGGGEVNGHTSGDDPSGVTRDREAAIKNESDTVEEKTSAMKIKEDRDGDSTEQARTKESLLSGAAASVQSLFGLPSSLVAAVGGAVNGAANGKNSAGKASGPGSRIVITTPDGTKYARELKCLSCGTAIAD